MAGQFEIFTDAEDSVRFRLLGADGTVLAISKAFDDKQSAAVGIMAVRECAGTGLIKEAHTNAWGGTGRTRAGLPTPSHRRHRHIPAV
ncbi:YegP family protein [Arthrobacter sp. PsM3]|uniref:YegP family protein n=1 Tax=Arthrobacter sp. PsM3 TaxID=3030531 RepID=UPI00263BA994|nr:YegP family protein [Arthrobacter sp. PsM3]MDN4644251.1 YegP family protein [Arthrobacter sp. PsM3]